MVRRGSSFAIVLLVASLLGCSGGDDDPSEGTSPPATTPVTLPDDADAGIGYLLLGEDTYLLNVRECALEPTTDPGTAITTDLVVAADDGVDINLAITVRTVPGDVPTTTENVMVQEDGVRVLAESQRISVAGSYQDLRAPDVLEPLINVEGTLVTARGVFGPLGTRVGDEGLVEGGVTLRCP